MNATHTVVTSNLILHYRNIANIIISSVVLLNLSWIYNYGTYRDISVPILFLHLTTDLTFASNELKLHHIFGILTCWVKYFYSIYNYDDWHIVHVLYKTELSSFFYVFKYWLEEENIVTKQLSFKQKKILQQINNALFYLSFFKFRVYDFTYEVILNIEGYKRMENYTNGVFFNQLFIYFGIFGLYMINLYWFTIMTKLLCKPIVKSILERDAILADHMFTKYSHFLHIPVVSYVYSMQPNESYFLDMIGIVGLSVASFEYHSAVINYFKTHNTIVYTSYELRGPYFTDQLLIHLRAFLSAVTALYYSENFNFIFISGSYHIVCCVALMRYLYILLVRESDEQTITEMQEKIIKYTNFSVSPPILFDIIIIAANSQNNIATIQLLLITYMCGVVLFIRPFYEFNHSVLHFCLMLHSYYVSQCNLR